MILASERRTSRRQLAIAALAIAAMALLALTARASAAELLYWNNYGGNPDNVAFANIDGSGGGLLNLSGSPEVIGPEGMAYDTVTNRLFVANEGGSGKGQITAINLDGSGAAPFTAPGAPIEEPEGVAVDPAARMIFWENTEGAGSIAWAKLDSSAGGVLNTAGVTVENPCCRIAIDPVGGRVYWVNNPPGESTIAYANLNNTGGGGELSLTGSTVEPGGEGLAVDPAGGRLYFLGSAGTSEAIGFANLNGSGGGDVATGTAPINSFWGIGLDPAIGRLYWANEGNGKEERANAFGFVGTNGAGAGGINIASAPVASPQDPVIIKSPVGAGVPTITRSTKVRSELACSQGSWGADYPGSFVYQAPRTYAYQWTLNGAAIGGATAPTLTATQAGSYACVVTAANQAGSGSQTSAATSVTASKMKLTTKKKARVKPGGVATFKVKAVNQGDLETKNARVCAKVPKKAKKALKAPKCKKFGKVKAGGKKTATLKFKVGENAAGTYKVKFLVKGSSGKAIKAKILVAAPKVKKK